MTVLVDSATVNSPIGNFYVIGQASDQFVIQPYPFVVSKLRNILHCHRVGHGVHWRRLGNQYGATANDVSVSRHGDTPISGCVIASDDREDVRLTPGASHHIAHAGVRLSIGLRHVPRRAYHNTTMRSHISLVDRATKYSVFCICVPPNIAHIPPVVPVQNMQETSLGFANVSGCENEIPGCSSPDFAEQFLAYVIDAKGSEMIWTIRDMSPAMAKKQAATSAKK